MAAETFGSAPAPFSTVMLHKDHEAEPRGGVLMEQYTDMSEFAHAVVGGSVDAEHLVFWVCARAEETGLDKWPGVDDTVDSLSLDDEGGVPYFHRLVVRRDKGKDGRGVVVSGMLVGDSPVPIRWVGDDEAPGPGHGGIRWSPVNKETLEAGLAFVRSLEDPLADPRPYTRAGWDHKLNYGDGGMTTLYYPAYSFARLPVPARVRRTLVDSLDALSERRQDHHPSGPVEDIVDPDLRPHVFRDAPPVLSKDTVVSDYYVPPSREPRDPAPPVPHPMPTRATTRWVPADFVLSSDGTARIDGEIHNLPRTAEHEPLYGALASVFGAMLPLWRRLGLGPDGGEERRLQVVVKAQAYNMLPNSSYQGKWHSEGVTERCVAAGVYYAEVGAGLTGGRLRFSPPTCPHRETYEIFNAREVEVGEGTAVAFSNSMVHRARTIYNRTADPQRRLFVNFFVLHPEDRVPRAGELPTEAALAGAFGDALPDDLRRLCMSYVTPAYGHDADARAFRARCKEEMSRGRGKFGDIFFGNSGDMKWLSGKRLRVLETERYNEYDLLDTTASEAL